jgi:hypothetical protein
VLRIKIEIMYTEVYEAMVDSRVAIKLDEEVHVKKMVLDEK